MKSETIKVVYIGNEFYHNTGSMMSSMYKKTTKGFERYDFGFFQTDIDKGHQVHVRKANDKEMKFFYKLKRDLGY